MSVEALQDDLNLKSFKNPSISPTKRVVIYFVMQNNQGVYLTINDGKSEA